VATTKKSDSWFATLSIAASSDAAALTAALSCEEGELLDGDEMRLRLTADRVTDVRARLNSAFRALIAADEALMSLDG